jgi:H+-transporting ATPase
MDELAGVDVLCSDKTGTLTQNKLTLSTPIPFGETKPEDIVFGAALATKAGSEDAIDAAVLKAVTNPKALNQFKQTKLVPFDPVNKRTMTTVVDADGRTWQYAKGAPQAISALCKLDPTTDKSYSAKVDDLAKHGYRALGVASSADDGRSWTLLGLLPLLDPPRPDAKATIAQTKELGLSVKMVTGDDVAIGSEISEQLGLGTHLLVAGDVFAKNTDPDHIPLDAARAVEHADGFGRVFPQHKYEIVKSLQELGHIVAMTGDGVNDAPLSSRPTVASRSAARPTRRVVRPL